MKSFRDLEAWKVGLGLVIEIYQLTKKLPKEEQFGLTAQMRKASTSVLANIAEGFGRYTYPDKANKFTIARGECNEIEAFVYIIVELKFVTSEDVKKVLELIDHEEKLLSGLINSCRKRE